MKTPKKLSNAYLAKHAHPGESWSHALLRLEGEVKQRYCELPVCPICAAQAESIDHAARIHNFGTCVLSLEAWPTSALSPRLFEVVHEQSSLHTQALSALALNSLKARLAHIRVQDYPVNALMLARGAQGYVAACEDFGLFEGEEYASLKPAVYAEEEKARSAFMELYRLRDPDALPWRST